MKKEYIIYDIQDKTFFVGSDMDGPWFNALCPRYFADEGAALARLVEEQEFKPSAFHDRVITILPVYKF